MSGSERLLESTVNPEEALTTFTRMSPYTLISKLNL
jgi:hypothetical protein